MQRWALPIVVPIFHSIGLRKKYRTIGLEYVSDYKQDRTGPIGQDWQHLTSDIPIVSD